MKLLAFDLRFPKVNSVETPFVKRIVTLIHKRKFSKVSFEKADAPLA